MAKKKFDTNPLDPEFPKRAAPEAEAARQQQQQQQQQEPLPPPAETTPNLDARTRMFSSPPPAPAAGAPTVVAEEPTRRYDNANFIPPYVPPFDGQNVPAAYQTSRFAEMSQTNDRKVDKVGLPENILTAMPYVPFYIGLIAGLLVLFFVPKSETKVRFHAAQGLAAHLAILIVTAILGAIGNITDLANIGSGIFQIVTTIMLIIFSIKAWQGKPVHIEWVDDLTEWLEEKIKPMN